MIWLLLACADTADIESSDGPVSDGREDRSVDPCHLSFSYALGETVLTGTFDSAGRTGTLEGWVDKGVVTGVWSEDGGASGELTGALFESEDWGLVFEAYGSGDDRWALYGFDQPGGAGGWFAFEEQSLDLDFLTGGALEGGITGTWRSDGVVWGELADGRTFEGDWQSEDQTLWVAGDVMVDDESDAWLDGWGSGDESGFDVSASVYPLWCAE